MAGQCNRMPGSAGQCSNIWGWMTPPTRNTSSRTGAATQQAKPCLHTCRGGYPCATSTTGSSCRARRESGELQASSKAAAAGCLWAHRPACILPATRAWLHPESLAPQQQQRRHAGNINYCSAVESTDPSSTLYWIHRCSAAFWVMQGRAVQSSHIPKQCRTGAVMQEALSCDHCASQADQHWLVQVGDWTSQSNVASRLHVAGSDLKGL